MIDPVYTFEEMEAACCVWEHCLSQMYAGSGPYNAQCQQNGTAAFRQKAMELGVKIQATYDGAGGPERYDAPFDWEFVPAVVELVLIMGESVTDAVGAVIKEFENR